MIESNDVIHALEQFESHGMIRRKQLSNFVDTLTLQYLKSNGLIFGRDSELVPGGDFYESWYLSERGKQALAEYREHQKVIADSQESMRLAKESLATSKESNRIAEKSLKAAEKSNQQAAINIKAAEESNRIAEESLKASRKSNRIAVDSAIGTVGSFVLASISLFIAMSSR